VATYRKVPAKILTVDYVGIATAESENYRKRAEAELSKIEGQVLRGNLDQGHRSFNIADNVRVECTVCFNLKQAVVVIGADINSKLKKEECYCCSPCLVAGRIIETKTRAPGGDDDYDEGVSIYEEDQDYFAKILVCQAPDATTPKSITLHEERSAGGVSIMKERKLQSMTYGAEEMYDVVYSDYQNHQVGDSVMVLVQPLYGFTPYPGEYLPCINQRKVADGVFELPQPTITVDYIESTGFSCQIVKDKAVWGLTGEEPEELNKLYPFRILPIKIESCL